MGEYKMIYNRIGYDQGYHISKEGYMMIYLPTHTRSQKGGYVYEHILIIEHVLGKGLELPHEVHHLDNDAANNENRNLCICEDHKYHMLLHVRSRVVKAGGIPGIHKICPRCRTVKLLTDFYTSLDRSDKVTSTCKQCILRDRKASMEKWEEKI
jgi:hypothetical protein